MRIERLSVFQVDLPYVGGSYGWGKHYSLSVGESFVVRIDTDDGLSGWGEVCPIGAVYLASHPKGVPSGIAELAPRLIGEDPTNLGRVNTIMDRWLLGHWYVKTPIDVACWDLLGKRLGAPVHQLLGGRQLERMPMYRAVPQGTPEKMAESVAAFRRQGYFQFQLKVGSEPATDAARTAAVVDILVPGEKLLVDANRAWRRDEAIHFAALTDDLFFYFEQPCDSYEDCLSVRGRVSQPFKLDETIETPGDLYRAFADDAMDEVCIKVAKHGGLSKARLMRDMCAARAMPMTVEDCWGGEIVTSALAHLAASTPAEVMLNTTDLHNYNSVSLGKTDLSTDAGHLVVGDAPGLGVEPDLAVLGAPIAEFH